MKVLKQNVFLSFRNHMISGVRPASSLSNSSALTSFLKTRLPVSTATEVGPKSLDAGNLTPDLFSSRSDVLYCSQLTIVGGATITVADVAATNGLIHVIDQVRSGGAGRQ